MIALDTVARQIRQQWPSRPVSFLLNRVRLRPVLPPGTGRAFSASGIPPSPSSCAAAQFRTACGGLDRVRETQKDDRLLPAAAIFCLVLLSSIGWALVVALVFGSFERAFG